MTELPPGLGAGDEDRVEAAAVMARLGGPGSVAAALGRDLAEGVRGRDVRLTASGDIAQLVQEHWAAALRGVGTVVHESSRAPGGDLARIHLHCEAGAADAYSPGGLGNDGGRDDDFSGELVGEVIGQGASPAARYSSLAIVADAMASELRT